MTRERNLINRILLDAAPLGARLFRNNSGVAHYRRGDHESRVVYGLHKGAPDIVGWMPLTIKPEHVGQTVAVFCGIEVKTKRATVTTEQKNFLAAVERDGGVAVVAREPDLDAAVRALRRLSGRENEE